MSTSRFFLRGANCAERIFCPFSLFAANILVCAYAHFFCTICAHCSAYGWSGFLGIPPGWTCGMLWLATTLGALRGPGAMGLRADPVCTAPGAAPGPTRGGSPPPAPPAFDAWKHIPNECPCYAEPRHPLNPAKAKNLGIGRRCLIATPALQYECRDHNKLVGLIGVACQER